MNILVFRRTRERGEYLQENATRAFEAWNADHPQALGELVERMRKVARAAADELDALHEAIASGTLEE